MTALGPVEFAVIALFPFVDVKGGSDRYTGAKRLATFVLIEEDVGTEEEGVEEESTGCED